VTHYTSETALNIAQVLSGESLKLLFPDPASDPRMPDIVIQPTFGTIYADADSGFIEEHGGFTEEDTHVPLVLALPSFQQQDVKTPVRTAQIAPTILQELELDPESLEAVRKEMTRTLPGIPASRDK